MTSTALSQRLNSWADQHSGTRSELARKLSSDLGEEGAGTLWSLVNIRAEFESRTSNDYSTAWLDRGPIARLLPSQAKNILQFVINLIDKILPLAYLVPIGITWFHLQGVLRAYKLSGSQLEPGETIDFLSLWSGARPDLFDGTQMATVAVQVFWSIVVIAILHALSSTQNENDKIDQELDALILDIQLELSKSRAVTPQELSDSLTEAANKLEAALQQTSSTLSSLNDVSSKMQHAADTLNDVSSSMSASAASVEAAVQPLIELPTSIDRALAGISGLPERLIQVQQKIDASTSNLSMVAEMTRNIVNNNEDVASQSRQLLEAIRQINATTSQSVSVLRDSARVVTELSEIVDGHRPHSVVMRETAELMKEVRNSIDRVADEFRYSAEQYQRVNDEHRNQG
jgi:ABC-type transporter Mla subunit MlaD